MRILFTGGSSFTGYWLIKELARSGHEVYATFTAKSIDEYKGIRGERVKLLSDICTPVWDCVFGQDNFLELINKSTQGWDVFCHHAADVTNYKSADFDIGSALTSNTYNLQVVLDAIATSGCKKLVITGSVFEPDEGLGEEPLRAFSPYGLSKGLTAQIFKYWCEIYGFSLGKFVIPNPFGPFEEPRFTAYLVNTWRKGNAAGVNTPDYIRDNIHISLLSIAYRKFVQSLPDKSGFMKINPTGYIESQGRFAQRFAAEMSKRLNIPCELDLANQTIFDEPRIRVNNDIIDISNEDWNESQAWDSVSEFYLNR